jgi:hypothetical protein
VLQYEITALPLPLTACSCAAAQADVELRTHALVPCDWRRCLV